MSVACKNDQFRDGREGSAEGTFASVFTFDLPSCSTPSAVMAGFSGPRKPRARKTSCAGKNFSDPGTSSIFHRPPLSFVHSTRTVSRPLSLPSSSTTKSFVEMQYSRGSVHPGKIRTGGEKRAPHAAYRCRSAPQLLCGHNLCGKSYTAYQRGFHSGD